MGMSDVIRVTSRVIAFVMSGVIAMRNECILSIPASNGNIYVSAQLKAINRMSWAKVLCELFPELGEVQKRAFKIG